MLRTLHHTATYLQSSSIGAARCNPGLWGVAPGWESCLFRKQQVPSLKPHTAPVGWATVSHMVNLVPTHPFTNFCPWPPICIPAGTPSCTSTRGNVRGGIWLYLEIKNEGCFHRFFCLNIGWGNDIHRSHLPVFEKCVCVRSNGDTIFILLGKTVMLNCPLIVRLQNMKSSDFKTWFPNDTTVYGPPLGSFWTRASENEVEILDWYKCLQISHRSEKNTFWEWEGQDCHNPQDWGQRSEI